MVVPQVSLVARTLLHHNCTGATHIAASPATPLDWRQYIESTPDVLRGKPRIAGTRIPVALIFGYLASGADTGAILAEFPDLRPEHVRACLDYARELADFEVATT